jgi:hypothetical protein
MVLDDEPVVKDDPDREARKSLPVIKNDQQKDLIN